MRSSVGSKPNEEPEEPLEVRVSPPGGDSGADLHPWVWRASVGRDGSVSLSWNRPSDNGGSAIIRYEVPVSSGHWERRGASGRTWERGRVGVTVGNLINGREYSVRGACGQCVGQGRGGDGAGHPGAAGLRLRLPPPGAPGGGGGRRRRRRPAVSTRGAGEPDGDARGRERCGWNGGRPESDGGTPILRYEYRLKEGRGEFGEWTPIEDSAPGEVNATGYHGR